MNGDEVIYTLKAETYNRLVKIRNNATLPLVLILLCLPPKQDEWHEMCEEFLKIRRCCYWLHWNCGLETTNTSGINIHFPRSQIFTPEALVMLFQQTLFSSPQQRPPIARRIVERITRGFVFVEEAERHQNAEFIYKNYYDGINYNMCNAILMLVGQNRDVNMEFSVSWSPLIMPNKDLGFIEPIFVEKGAYRYLQEAADFMRKDNMDVLSIASEASLELLLTENQVIHGKITDLSARSKNQRVATVSWNGERQFYVPLHPEIYEAAFKAHIEFLTVSIIGRLVERNHELTLLDIIDFRTEQ